MKPRLKAALTALSFLIFCTTSPIPLEFWFYEIDTFTSVIPNTSLNLLPRHNKKPLFFDNNHKVVHSNNESISLIRSVKDKDNLSASENVTISKQDNLVWQSPKDWHIKQVLITDLNRDGSSELVLLVWRDFKLWPIDEYLIHPGRIKNFHNSRNQSCHIILMGWRKDKFKEIWAGSAMADPILEIHAADINNDGVMELIALEGKYDENPSHPVCALTAWEWNGFGFSLLARQSGYFQHLLILQDVSGKEYFLTQ